MSTPPEPTPRPFYRRPLVLIIAGAVVVILIVGGLVAFVANNALAPRTLAASGTSSPTDSPSATVTPVTPVPTVTVTVAPSVTPTANPVAAPPAPKPPAVKPITKPVTKPPTKPAPITPAISHFTVAATSTLCGTGETSVASKASWTSTNAMRGSLTAVASYPSYSSHPNQTSTIVLDSVQGPLTFSSSCQFAKIVFTLRLEHIVNGSPTYASATSTLVLYG